MLDDLVAHADVARLYIIFHVLLQRWPIKSARKKLCCSVTSRVSGVGGVVMLGNYARAKSRMLWNEQTKEYMVVFKTKIFCWVGRRKPLVYCHVIRIARSVLENVRS